MKSLLKMILLMALILRAQAAMAAMTRSSTMKSWCR